MKSTISPYCHLGMNEKGLPAARYEGKLLNTRQQIDFVDKFARTNVRAMSMRIVGVKLWNALDHCLKNSKTRCIFSKSYKENVLRSCYYNDHNTVVAL